MSTKDKHKNKVRKIPTTIHTAIEKPTWIKVKTANATKVSELKNLLRSHNLHTVCEEASCPNIFECFSKGTATFMIMGSICTRRCSFCDVAYGKPLPLDNNEPDNLAMIIQKMQLSYVVITSVDRDDLLDAGALHFANCIHRVRKRNPNIKIEILVPDFKGKVDVALKNLSLALPDVFNHNLETVPRLYQTVRPQADYIGSLKLLESFKKLNPTIPTKSGIMLGLGETLDEVKNVLVDLKTHACDMVTIGQYLQPSDHHHPVIRYATIEEFDLLKSYATTLGFSNIASGPLVRSSYHADLQAAGVIQV